MSGIVADMSIAQTFSSAMFFTRHSNTVSGGISYESKHPEYYQINTVKPEVLKEIKSKINDNMIIKNIDYALNNPASDDSVKHFWKRVLHLNNKNHNIENFIPEIKEIIR